MIKVVIFDCFGVVRIDPTFIAYRQLGGDDIADREFIERALHASDSGQIPDAGAMIAERLGVSEDKWQKTSMHASPFDDNMLDYILSLRSFYKTALLTNIGSSEGTLSKWFKPHVLETYFDVAIASGEIGFAKPEPQAYQITAERLGIRPAQCIMVDDRQINSEGARAAGMHAITYMSLDQLKDDVIPILVAENEK